jgi:hypothetical protein
MWKCAQHFRNDKNQALFLAQHEFLVIVAENARQRAFYKQICLYQG